MLNQELDDQNNPRSSLIARFETYRQQEQKLAWTGTFADYLEIACQRPQTSRLSHARIHDMLTQSGVEEVDGKKKYNFFGNEIFGLEETLSQVYDYFGSAAKGMETKKRILLFMGPVGGGKSTIVALLKRGLEKYTETDPGEVYALDGCPMHEEPLHLVPDQLRSDIRNEFGLHIEGDLCPHCRFRLKDQFNGKMEDFPVRRIVFSEKHRVGIGTFQPSDPKSQDITELTGSIDLSTIGEYGSESDPRAYRFDGELNIANRGVMEFIEMLKVDEKFLYGLLTLSQEQSIKAGRFAMIYADEVILSHTNESEYQSFVQNPKAEALRDRIITIRVPYNLRVSDEVKIYEKLIGQSNLKIGKESAKGEVHISPKALEVAAKFAVLSRLEAPKKAGLSLMKKLKLYNGENVEGATQNDLKEIKDATEREGMDGISPRYISNRLSKALTLDGTVCINPISVLRSLRDGFEQHTGITREERDGLLNLLAEVRRDFDESAKIEVQKAFVHAFDESARTLFNNYLDQAEAYCNKTKVKDPITEELVDPDEKLMRSIEDQIGVSENAKRAFREELLIRISTLARKGQQIDFNSHDRLREGIQRKLFADMKDVVKITTSTKTPDPEQLKKIDNVKEVLCQEHGYCDSCSTELLNYVGTLMNR